MDIDNRFGQGTAVYQVAERTQREGADAPLLEKGDEIIDMGADFDFEGFQVVRREFFAHLAEPAATFNNCKFYVNSACLAKFPETYYVEVLVNREQKTMALMPCEETVKDSLSWCSKTKGKRKPKQTTCKIFFAEIAHMMDWAPNHRYKILGKLAHANGRYLIVFDLKAAEVYERTMVEGEKPKVSRTPIYPSEWRGQFGLPYKEHQQSMQINIFDGYAIYSIKDAVPTTADPAAEVNTLSVVYDPTYQPAPEV